MRDLLSDLNNYACMTRKLAIEAYASDTANHVNASSSISLP